MRIIIVLLCAVLTAATVSSTLTGCSLVSSSEVADGHESWVVSAEDRLKESLELANQFVLWERQGNRGEQASSLASEIRSKFPTAFIEASRAVKDYKESRSNVGRSNAVEKLAVLESYRSKVVLLLPVELSNQAISRAKRR